MHDMTDFGFETLNLGLWLGLEFGIKDLELGLTIIITKCPKIQAEPKLERSLLGQIIGWMLSGGYQN